MVNSGEITVDSKSFNFCSSGDNGTVGGDDTDDEDDDDDDDKADKHGSLAV